MTLVTGQAHVAGLKAKDGATGGAAATGADGEATDPSVFSWHALITFGFDGSLTAEQLRLIELQVEAFVLRRSIENNSKWNKRLVVHVPEESASTTKKVTACEVLLEFDPNEDSDKVLSYVASSERKMFKLPSDLKLYFTGSIGGLTQQLCFLILILMLVLVNMIMINDNEFQEIAFVGR